MYVPVSLDFNKNNYKYTYLYTVKPAQAVTCIKRSPFSCPVITNFTCIEPLLRGDQSEKATFSLSQR